MRFFRWLYVKGGGDTWQVRCGKCGLTRDALKAGQIRLWAAGRPFKLLRCPQCHRLRWHRIEKKQEQSLHA